MKTQLNPIALETMNTIGAPVPVNFDPEHNALHLLELMGAININVFFLNGTAHAIPGEEFGGEEFETWVGVEGGPNAKSLAMKVAIFNLLEKLLPTL